MNPENQDTDRRVTDRRSEQERRADGVRAMLGDRREGEQRGLVASMTDALEDILKWERASERSIKVVDARIDTPKGPTSGSVG